MATAAATRARPRPVRGAVHPRLGRRRAAPVHHSVRRSGARPPIDADTAAGRRSAVPAPQREVRHRHPEDSLGELEALADDVPQIMQNRFRLGALDPKQAEAAIREPAMWRTAGSTRSRSGTAKRPPQQILDFLQDTEGDAMHGIAVANMARSVDPSQLQIICQYVERRVLPRQGHRAGRRGRSRSKPPTSVAPRDSSDVLGDFYRRTVRRSRQPTQRSVQHLCEDGLISKSGRRLSLEREEIRAHVHGSRRTCSTTWSTSGSCGPSRGSAASTTNSPTTRWSSRSSPTDPSVARPRCAVAADSASSPWAPLRCSCSACWRIASASTRARSGSRRWSSRPR